MQSCDMLNELSFSRKFEFGDRENALTHLVLLLDPLSEGAQKWIAILEVSRRGDCRIVELMWVTVETRGALPGGIL